MALKQLTHTDASGRKTMVLLPEEAKEEEIGRAIPLGPPSLKDLGLPEEIEIRLHNELFNRGVYGQREALRGRQEILGAITSALKVDVDRIVTIYLGENYKIAKSERQEAVSPPVGGNPSANNYRRRRR